MKDFAKELIELANTNLQGMSRGGGKTFASKAIKLAFELQAEVRRLNGILHVVAASRGFHHLNPVAQQMVRDEVKSKEPSITVVQDVREEVGPDHIVEFKPMGTPRIELNPNQEEFKQQYLGRFAEPPSCPDGRDWASCPHCQNPDPNHKHPIERDHHGRVILVEDSPHDIVRDSKAIQAIRFQKEP